MITVVVRHGGFRRTCGDHCWTNRVELASCFSTPRLETAAGWVGSRSGLGSLRRQLTPSEFTWCQTNPRKDVVASRYRWWAFAARQISRDSFCSREDGALYSAVGLGLVVGLLTGPGPQLLADSSIDDRIARCESGTNPAPSPSQPRRTRATPTSKQAHPIAKSHSSPVWDGNSIDHDEDQDEDEPTDCFLCRTHRRGPCRMPWRQLERCVAAPTSSSANIPPAAAVGPSPSSSPPTEAECTAAARSFEACWRKHPNLHYLIALQVQQEDLLRRNQQGADLAPSRKSRRRSSSEWDATIDWTAWTEFAAGPSAGELVRTYRSRCGASPAPLWERFAPTTTSSSFSPSTTHHHSDPHLVTVECRVPPALQGQATLLAYAVDQHDRLLGFAEPRRSPNNNNNPGETLQTSDAATMDKDNSALLLRITIVPGVTESVRVCARTAANKSGRRGEDRDGPSGGLLFRSPRWPVDYAALHQPPSPKNRANHSK